MSSQKGNVSRSRGQKHQNVSAYRNNKYGATVQVKKANSKIHDGLCQHCKGILEWKVKYNKYKSLTQPKKCVKCSQKAVKDAYHIICKPCSLQLEICCKCGKKEEIIVPINSQRDETEEDGDGEQRKKKGGQKVEDFDDSDSDEDHDGDELSDFEDDDDDGEDLKCELEPKKTQKKSDVLPDVARIKVAD